MKAVLSLSFVLLAGSTQPRLSADITTPRVVRSIRPQETQSVLLGMNETNAGEKNNIKPKSANLRGKKFRRLNVVTENSNMIGMTAGLDKQVSIGMHTVALICSVAFKTSSNSNTNTYIIVNYSNIPTTAGHNVRRCRHGLGDIKWDEGLVKVAKAHAAKCVYQHSKSWDKSHAVIYTLV